MNKIVLISDIDNTQYYSRFMSPGWEMIWIKPSPNPVDNSNNVYEIKPDIVLMEHSLSHDSCEFSWSSRDTYWLIMNDVKKVVILNPSYPNGGYGDAIHASDQIWDRRMVDERFAPHISVVLTLITAE